MTNGRRRLGKSFVDKPDNGITLSTSTRRVVFAYQFIFLADALVETLKNDNKTRVLNGIRHNYVSYIVMHVAYENKSFTHELLLFGDLYRFAGKQVLLFGRRVGCKKPFKTNVFSTVDTSSFRR